MDSVGRCTVVFYTITLGVDTPRREVCVADFALLEAAQRCAVLTDSVVVFVSHTLSVRIYSTFASLSFTIEPQVRESRIVVLAIFA